MNIYKELRRLAIKMDADVSNTHNIKDVIRAMSAKLGGDSNGAAIADAVKNLADAHDTEPTLRGLVVDTEIGASEDLLGKTIDDLQDGLKVDGDIINGKVYYLDDYTGFSSDPEEQVGNFIAVHASVPDVTGVTIKVRIDPYKKTSDVTLDSDGILVFRVTDKRKQKLTFTASKSGFSDYSRTYSLIGLACDKTVTEVESSETDENDTSDENS